MRLSKRPWYSGISRPFARRLILERLEDRSLPSASPLSAALPLAFGALGTAHVSHFLASPAQVALYAVNLQPGDVLDSRIRAHEAGTGLVGLIRVFDGDGRPLASNDQSGGDPALRFQAASAGTYYVGVSSAPNNDYDPAVAADGAPGATTGLFNLDVRLTNAARQPDLTGSSFRLGAEMAAPGETVPLSFVVDNRGGADAGDFRVEVVLARDNLFGAASQVLATLSRSQLSASTTGRNFASPAGFAVTLPASLASGRAFVGLRIVPDLPESDASNNGAVHAGADWAPLTVVTPLPAGVTILSQADPGLNVGAVGDLAGAEADVYPFTVSEALGDGRLTADVRANAGTLAPRLTLSGPGGELLLQSEGRLELHLTPGTYSLSVSARSGQGAYRLDVAFAQASRPFTPLPSAAGTFTVAVADVNNDGLDDVITGNRIDNTARVFLGRGDGTFRRLDDFALGARVYRLTVADVNNDGNADLLSGNKGDNTASVLLGNGDGTFRDQIVIPAGTRINGALAADVNGDGRPDMIQDNYADDTIWVLLGNGDGSFVAPDVYPIGDTGTFQGPSDTAVADVNGDGIVDLLYANYVGGTVGVRLGEGDGTFGPQRLFAAGAGAGEVDVADVNGDGRPDVVSIDSVDGTVSVLRGNGDGSFAARQVFPVGANPYSGAVADVNGDGRLDVVTGNRDDNTVSVLLGNGDGTFAPQRVFRTGKTPNKVAAGDLDGDGKVDLVTANTGDDTATVLKGNGDGTFVSGRQSAPAPDVRPFQVVVADLNGDGRPDVATANRSDHSVGVLLSNADGSFQSKETFAVDLQPFGIAAADVNGDGVPDLLTANYAGGSVSVLLGNGDGTFAPHQDLTAGSNVYGVRVDDLNADGILDVVCTNKNDDTVGVFLGLGGGAFAPMVSYAVASGPYELVIHDLDDDGVPDVVVSHFSATVIDVLMGNGDGTFRPTRQYPVGSRPYGLAVADVNGDGVPDVATSNYRSSDASILLGNGDGTFAAPTLFPTGRAPNEAQLGDLDGDGILDLVTANYGSDDVSVLLGNGDGSFGPHRTFPAGSGPASVAVADVDGDGALDLTVANRDVSSIHVLFGNGDGSFAAPLPFGANKNRYSAAVADLNGDGNADLITSRLLQNDVTVQLGNGTGTFGPPQSVAVGAAPTAVALADLNGDGRLDLVTADSRDDALSVLLGNGDGSFASRQTFPVGRSPRAVQVADLDGDGIPDLAATNYHDGTVSVLLGNGAGTFAPQRSFAVGAKPYSLAIADVNGDGRPDLITANSADGTASVLLNLGGGNFAPQQTFAAGRQPFAVAVADVDGDGDADLVTADTFDDRVSVLQGNGDGTFGGRRTFAVGSRPYSVAVSDVNGDGNADLVTADYRSHAVSVLLGDGSGSFASRRAFAAVPLPALTLGADVNGDGLPDLVTVGNSEREGGVLLGKGDGTFQAVSGSTGVDVRATPILADLDGDGLADRIVLDRSGTILFRKGLSNAFAPPVALNPGRPARDVTVVRTGAGLVLAAADARFDPALSGSRFVFAVSLYSVSSSPPSPLPVGEGSGVVVGRTVAFTTEALPARLEAADLTGDGLDELIAASALDDSVSIAIQTSPGHFAAPLTMPAGAAPSDVAVADVNGDGRLDVLVSAQASGDVSVLLNDAAHSFARSLRFRAGGAAAASEAAVVSAAQSVAIAAGDFTGDGLIDVAVVNRGLHHFAVLEGNGSGGFAEPRPNLTTSTSDGFRVNDRPGAIVRGDFDRDGDLDLAVLLEDTSRLWIYTAKGDGTFARTFSIAVGDQGTGLSVIPGSSPGLLDLLVGNGFGDVLHLEGRGDGTFQIRGKRVSLSVIPDLFGAGQAGVLVGNQQDNRVTVQTSTSGGSQFETVQTLGDSSTQLAPGDVQFARLRGALALPDAIVVSTGSNSVVVYRTTGVSGGVPSFSAVTQTFFVGTSPVGATVADVNADGVMDLIIANQGSNDVSVVFGSLVDDVWVGTPGPRLRSGGAGPIAATARDVTGDGVVDLVVTNGASGTLTMLPGVGRGFFDDRQPATLFDLGGAIVQPPTFLGDSGVGIAVTAAGQLVRFDLSDVAAGAEVVFAEEGVVAARVLQSGQVVVALSGGSVKVLADQGGGLGVAAELQAQAGVPVLPSSLEVIQSGGQFQVLVSSQGSDTIFVFAQAAGPPAPPAPGDVPPVFTGGLTPTLGGGATGATSGGVAPTPALGGSSSFVSAQTITGGVGVGGLGASTTGISSNVSTSLALTAGTTAAVSAAAGSSAAPSLGGTAAGEGSGSSSSSSASASASLVSVQGNAYAAVAVLDFGGGNEETSSRRGARSALATTYALGDTSPLTRFVTGHDEALERYLAPDSDRPPEEDKDSLEDPWREDLFHRLKPPRLPRNDSEEMGAPPSPQEEKSADDSGQPQDVEALDLLLASLALAPLLPLPRPRTKGRRR